MGAVYLATDVALQRKVAIKVLASELCGDEEFSARFEREARLTAHLDHPNVVMVFGVGSHLGQPFIVMKHIEGETVSRRLARQVREHLRGLDYDEVLSIAEQLCAGLGYIHSKGFVHRDIKTGNIILGPDGRATILDFGILRDTRSREELTKTGMMLGTPVYVSPEQILGKKADHRADLYALGIMLYELLTGLPPFDAASDFQIIEMHVRAEPPDLCQSDPDLPHEVCEVLARSIAKRPEDRYQSAAALYAALAKAFGRKAGPGRARGRRGSVPSASGRDESPEVEEAPTTQVLAGRRSGSLRWGLWAAAGAALLLLAGAVVALLDASEGASVSTGLSPIAPPQRPQALPAARKPAPVPEPEPEEAAGEDDEWEYYYEDEEEPADAGAPREDGNAEPSPVDAENSLLKKAVKADPGRMDAVLHGEREQSSD